MRTTLISTFALAVALVLTVPAGARVDAYAPVFPANYYGAWSPDGKRIAFTSNRFGTADIFVMNADGTQQRPVVRDDGADEWWPAWSPDGKLIAFVSDRDNDGERGQIYSVELATRHVTRLTYSDADDYGPAWSADDRIAFVRNEDEGGQIHVMNSDGNGVTRVVADDEDHATPAWSPDSTKIAFVGGETDDGFIDVVNADGTGRVRLTTTSSDFRPAWSPDGRQIVFQTYRANDTSDIWIMNADGSDQRWLLGTESTWEVGARFAPGGKQIVFVSDATGESQVYTASASGTGMKRLTGLARILSSTGRRCTLIGTPGRDVLRGIGRDDVICGLGGDDILYGGGGDDLVDGGPGTDEITGGPGDDTMLGGAGTDRFDAVDGFRDSLDGGAGRDRARIDPNDWISSIEDLF
jgi:Tol biopolymer transport system component